MHLLIFRRDLRVEDNTALNFIIDNYTKSKVYCIFLFNDLQINPKKNKYFSDCSVKFMIQSLENLQKYIKIHYYFCKDEIKVLTKLVKKLNITNIHWHEDVTPYAIKRDNEIIKFCKDNNIESNIHSTYFLTNFSELKSNSDTYYKVYTPFKKKVLTLKINKPITKNIKNITIVSKYVDIGKMHHVINPHIYYNKDTPEFESSKKFNHKFYAETRNFPSLIDGTSRMSAANKFGTISIRELWYKYTDETYRSELIWRDFYYYLIFWNPSLLAKQINPNKQNQPLNYKMDKFPWKYNNKHFEAWKNGLTGVPIVDAGMRQMNQTGWMHNRVRMIVAMYLTKILQIDWRLGEQYFATKLVDYDPCQNNGGWQWSSSTGADAQPYFRIFNPYLQMKRFDKDAIYCKLWVDELKTVEPKDLLQWDIPKIRKKYNLKYPEPIVDYKIMRQDTLNKFTSIT